MVVLVSLPGYVVCNAGIWSNRTVRCVTVLLRVLCLQNVMIYMVRLLFSRFHSARFLLLFNSFHIMSWKSSLIEVVAQTSAFVVGLVCTSD